MHQSKPGGEKQLTKRSVQIPHFPSRNQTRNLLAVRHCAAFVKCHLEWNYCAECCPPSSEEHERKITRTFADLSGASVAWVKSIGLQGSNITEKLFWSS